MTHSISRPIHSVRIGLGLMVLNGSQLHTLCLLLAIRLGQLLVLLQQSLLLAALDHDYLVQFIDLFRQLLAATLQVLDCVAEPERKNSTRAAWEYN